MELQDFLYLIIFLAVTVLSGMRKSAQREQKSGQEIEKVRRKIQALKQARSAPSARIKDPVASKQPQAPAHHAFPAYKHLSVPSMEDLRITEVPVNTQTKAQSLKKQTGVSRPSLRSWILGQVILDRPAFKKDFYGNFMDR